MCNLKDLPAFQKNTGDEGTDEYKNPGSGISTPQWKLAIKANGNEANINTASGFSPNQEGEMNRSEISG